MAYDMQLALTALQNIVRANSVDPGLEVLMSPCFLMCLSCLSLSITLLLYRRCSCLNVLCISCNFACTSQVQ